MQLRRALIALLIAAGALMAFSTGEAHAFAGTQLWSVAAGSSDQQSGENVAVDAAGNVFFSGIFENTIDLGGDTHVSNGGYDIFVAKYDQFGNFLWSAAYGGAGNQLVHDTAVDGAGNVVLAGSFVGSVDFGGGTLTASGSADIFVAKLDVDGDHLWSQSFGDASTQEAFGVAIDASENVIIAGEFAGSANFGGGTLTATLADAFVAKFNGAGVHLWSARYGDAGTQSAFGVAIAPGGDIVLDGRFDLAIDLGGGQLADADGVEDSFMDIFVARLDGTGAHVWSKRYGDANNQTATSVDVDGAGNVLLTGGFQNTIDFGGGALVAPGGANDIFLAKLEGDGDHVWSKRFSASLGYGHDVAADSSNNVLLTGYYAIGSANFGGGAFPQVMNTDAFLAKFDPDGNHTWSKRFQGYEDSDLGNGVATGPGNHVYLAASLASEAFVAKFDGAVPTDGEGDGCTDAEERGHTSSLGGNRDPLSPWDFYDVDGTKKVDGVDIARVRSKFMQNYPPYDRSSQGVASPFPGPPDGIVNAVDIALVRYQFGHNCQALPN